MDKKAPLKDEIMNRGVETGAGCSEGERWSLERQPIDSKVGSSPLNQLLEAKNRCIITLLHHWQTKAENL